MHRIFYLLFLVRAIGAQGQTSERVQLHCNWNDTAGIPLNQQAARFSGCWGWTAPDGREYGFIGSTLGTHVIDVATCQQVDFADGRAAGNFILRREYKTYRHYLYAICDEGTSSLQVFDLRYLPDSLHLVWESNPADFSRAHELFIDTARAKLYLASAYGVLTGDDFLRVYSLADPEAPAHLLDFNTYEKVHSLFVRNDTAFCSMGFYGMAVIDFSAAPVWSSLGMLLSYPMKGFNHSSWQNETRMGVMTDESYGSPVKIIDAAETANIRVRSTWSPRPGDNTCIPHNAYVRGNFAFIAYYYDGLQILDISDPYAPVRAGFYDSYPGAAWQGYAGAWGAYPFFSSGKIMFSDMQTGLYVVDPSEALAVARGAEPALQVYPNPAATTLNVRWPKPGGGTLQWRVLDPTGRLAGSGFADRANDAVVIPLAARWPGGLYLLQLTDGSTILHTRFTKL